MPVANPIVEGIPGRGPVAATPPQPSPEPPTSAPNTGGFSMSRLEGFSHPDNTSMHCGILVAAALGVVIFFYLGGFKFAVDAGVTRG